MNTKQDALATACENVRHLVAVDLDFLRGTYKIGRKKFTATETAMAEVSRIEAQMKRLFG